MWQRPNRDQEKGDVPFPHHLLQPLPAVSCPEHGTGTSHPAQELVSVGYSPGGQGMTCSAVSVQRICAHLKRGER